MFPRMRLIDLEMVGDLDIRCTLEPVFLQFDISLPLWAKPVRTLLDTVDPGSAQPTYTYTHFPEFNIFGNPSRRK